MKNRKIGSWEGAPADLRPVSVDEWDDLDIYGDDVSDEELDDMFKPMDVESLVCGRKTSIAHPIDEAAFIKAAEASSKLYPKTGKISCVKKGRVL